MGDNGGAQFACVWSQKFGPNKMSNLGTQITPKTYQKWSNKVSDTTQTVTASYNSKIIPEALKRTKLFSANFHSVLTVCSAASQVPLVRVDIVGNITVGVIDKC